MKRKLSESERKRMMLRNESPLTIRHNKSGRPKLFYPVWKKKDAVETETRHFPGRVFRRNPELPVDKMPAANALTRDNTAGPAEILEKAKEETAK